MRFHVLTIFPGMFSSPLSLSIIARAKTRGLLDVHLHDIRDHANHRHNAIDDYPFGGGPGMIMKPEPLFNSIEYLRTSGLLNNDSPIVLLSPQGRRFDQGIAEEFSKMSEIVLICGRYEGVDDRVREHLATDEISIGDYVIGGGELAAMVVIDAATRLIPGVVGSSESTANDSFTTGLLQHPQFTRPSEFRGLDVPDVLLSGHHAEITRWKRRQALKLTLNRRPEMLASADLTREDDEFLCRLKQSQHADK